MAMMRRLRSQAAQALRHDGVRYWVARARFVYLARLRKKLATFDDSDPSIAAKTLEHNLAGMVDLAVSRSSQLIRPLSVIEAVKRDGALLSVGPRTEGEILNLVAHGFDARHIRGLDLISYSPFIDLGDMHAMPYEADRFDTVILGWVLAYSETPDRAAREVVRVAKHGAVIAVGVEYNPLNEDEIRQRFGYTVGRRERVQSVDEILSWFGDAVDVVYFRHDIAPERRGELGGIMTIFSLRKRPH